MDIDDYKSKAGLKQKANAAATGGRSSIISKDYLAPNMYFI